MNLKVYHLSCLTILFLFIFHKWTSLAILTIAWTFQIGSLILSIITLKTPRYDGVKEKIKRKCYDNTGVTILKPLLGNFDTLEENLETFFTLEYPTFEIIFCVEDEKDESCAIIKKLQEKYPDVSCFISEGKIEGTNPKICNMVTGYKAANFDLIWIADANIVASDAALQDMVDKCLNGYPLVHQIPWGVSGPKCEPTHGALTFGSALKRWYFATAHARPYFVFNYTISTCLNGMSHLISKKHLDNIGGLEKFANTISEDSDMGLAFDQYGYETIICKHPAIQNLRSNSISKYVDRRVRWARLRNNNFKTIYATPFEIIIDSHLFGILCGSLFSTNTIYHVLAWLLVDCIQFVIMDNATALPISWQNNKIYWGKITDQKRSVYYFIYNVVEHYIMWIVREYLGLYVRFKAIQSNTVVWKDKTIPLKKD